MSILTNFNYNDNIISRRADGFLNASQMCVANGKRLHNWSRLDATKAYTEALSEETQISVTHLIEIQHGNQTWVHPSLAINLARWISPKFAVWCDAHIFNLMTSGQTSLEIDPVQMMQLKIELAGLEAQKEIAIAQSKASELGIFHFRQNLIKLELPQVIEQKILGYQTIETVEYRDRVILNNQVIIEGDTLNKSELCHRYKILTKNGKPDYRRLNTILDRNGITERSEAWKMSAVIQENYQFKREYLADLDKLMINDDRQLFICE